MSARHDWRDAVLFSDLPSMQKLVAFAVSMYANGNGDGAYASVKTLSLRTSLSERTVQNALGGLVRAGWLEVVASARQHRPTTYALSTAGAAPLRGAASAGLSHPGVQLTTSRGAADDARGAGAAPDSVVNTKESVSKAKRGTGARSGERHQPEEVNLAYLDE